METKRPTVPAAEEILGGYFPVLDHGFVSLVDYMGSDEDVERAARVSYGHGTRKVSQTRGLIRYLRRHYHTTPSEMVELKFHCAMPIFVARQWIRHRTACLAEGTEVYFDLPGGIERPGDPLYKLRVEELWRRFQPSTNRRSDRRRYRFFRRDRVRAMHLRQVNEETLAIRHTRVVQVLRNGRKPVFRMTLADGERIESTADHRFLFADGWNTLREAVGLEERSGKARWNAGDHYLYVDGVDVEEPALYRDRDGSREGYDVRGLEIAELELAERPSTRAVGVKRAKRPRAPWSEPTKARLARIENFEYVGLRETYDLEVEGPHHNFVANGIVTHNSVNEYSGRYSLMPLQFYRPESRNFALQSRTNSQGRRDVPAPEELYADAIERWERQRAEAAETYGWLVAEEVAREIARIDLPLSTYTQWYWKIDLHNLFHFLTLRVDAHAQWEIREFGRVMAGMLQRVAPLSYEAWLDYNLLGSSLSAAEREVVHHFLEATEEGIAVRADGHPLSREQLVELGLSPREIRELMAKLEPIERPDFSLDLTRMRTAEEIQATMEAAIPGGTV